MLSIADQLGIAWHKIPDGSFVNSAKLAKSANVDGAAGRREASKFLLRREQQGEAERISVKGKQIQYRKTAKPEDEEATGQVDYGKLGEALISRITTLERENTRLRGQIVDLEQELLQIRTLREDVQRGKTISLTELKKRLGED